MKTKKKIIESDESDGELETDKENEWKDEESLGKGWKKKSVPRKGTGKHIDHYYRSPEGEVFNSMAKAKKVIGEGGKENDEISPVKQEKVVEKSDKRKSCPTPLSPKNVELQPVKVIAKMDRRQSCPNILNSPKYVEAFQNFLDKKSKSSRKEEKEKAMEREKMCNLKRKLDNELRQMEKKKVEEQKALNDKNKEKEILSKDKKEAPEVIESKKEVPKANAKKSIFEKAKKKETDDSKLTAESKEKLGKNEGKSSTENAKQSKNIEEGLETKSTANKKKSIFEKAKRKLSDSDLDSEPEEEPSKRKKVESVKAKNTDTSENVAKSNQSKLTVKKAKQNKNSDLDTETESEEENELIKVKSKNLTKKKSIEKDSSGKKSKEKKTKKSDLDTDSESDEDYTPKRYIKKKKSPKETTDKKPPKEKKESAKKEKNEEIEKESEGKTGKNPPKTKQKKNQEDDDDESDQDTKKNQPDKEKVESKPEKANKKNKRKSDYDFATESECEEEVEEQKKLMAELRKFFKDNNIQLKPRAPTRGDGNCFFRSVADQILLHKIADQPTTHRDLRLAVCNHIKNLPPDVLKSTVDIIYKGKRRGLADLASRQRKLGQFVDDYGIMVMSTALFLGRDIEVYSAHASGNQGHSVTKIDGGEGADKHSPLTIFYFKDYQHYQGVGPTGKTQK